MLKSESLLANDIYTFMRLYDWPMTYRELFNRFNATSVDFVAALVELRLSSKIVASWESGQRFYECR